MKTNSWIIALLLVVLAAALTGCPEVVPPVQPPVEPPVEPPIVELLASASIDVYVWCHITPDGIPAYDARYKGVGDFTEDGLAMAKDEDGYFHITPDGLPAYDERYSYAGDFHEGLAVVRDQNGYHHIKTEGKPAYDGCFKWAGNFSEGWANVTDFSGRAYHIKHNGQPAYNARYYATGEFHEGLAAVSTGYDYYYYPDGSRSIVWEDFCHITPDGQPAYDERYKSVGHFSEGLATAWIAGEGCFHITMDGQPAYDQRFSPLHYSRGMSTMSTHDFHEGVAVVDGSYQRLQIATNGNTIRSSVGRLGDFSEGLSAAWDDVAKGCGHITHEGEWVYDSRYFAVGKFVNGFAYAVTDCSGLYYDYCHIGLDGQPAYESRFIQVGDFQEVVTSPVS